MTDDKLPPALIHGFARLVRDAGAATGVRFWAGGPYEGAVRGAEDLPRHALELHVFGEADVAVGFAAGVTHVGGNSVSASCHGRLVLVAYLDREPHFSSGGSLEEAVPVVSVKASRFGNTAEDALRAARSDEDNARRRREEAAERVSNRNIWASLSAALAALPPMPPEIAGVSPGPDGRCKTAALYEPDRSATRVEIKGSFDPSGAWRDYHGRAQEHSLWAERSADTLMLTRGGWNVTPEAAAARRSEFSAAAEAAGWGWEPESVRLVRRCSPDGSDAGTAVLAYPPLARRLLELVDQCKWLTAARAALADEPGMKMLRGLSENPGYRVRQYSRNDPARLDTSRGGRSLPAKTVSWGDKLGFLEVAASKPQSWGATNFEWMPSALGKVAVSGDAEALAAMMRAAAASPKSSGAY